MLYFRSSLRAFLPDSHQGNPKLYLVFWIWHSIAFYKHKTLCNANNHHLDSQSDLVTFLRLLIVSTTNKNSPRSLKYLIQFFCISRVVEK